MSACPTCTWPNRETVGLVCQTCETDYGEPEPDVWRDPTGELWINLRKHPTGLRGAYDAESTCVPLSAA